MTALVLSVTVAFVKDIQYYLKISNSIVNMFNNTEFLVIVSLKLNCMFQRKLYLYVNHFQASLESN